MRQLVMALVMGVFAQSATAQETDIAGQFMVELNSAQSGEDTCKLSFLITNGLDTAIEEAVFEVVLFDAAGQVRQLTLFNFGELPQARPRVRQFTLPGGTCDGLSRILFNDLSKCNGEGLDPKTCMSALKLYSKTDAIEVLG